MRKRIRLVAAVFLVLCLVVTASLFFLAKRSGNVYQKVEVTVLSSQQSYRRDGDTRRPVTLVQVVYEGRTYELRNAGDHRDYAAGETVTAYLAGNRMYAGPSGITPDPVLAVSYFASMAVTFAAAAVFLISLAFPRRMRENMSE